MAANNDKVSRYAIHGRVVDRASRSGVRGVRVEAWDRDTKYHDLLGQARADEDGRFAIAFDSLYFGDYAPDRAPDLYFRVFLDTREVLNTFERPLMNSQVGKTEVVLEIGLPAPGPEGSDRVSAQQALKAVDWWRASDFRGTYREGVDKVGTVGRLVGRLLGSSIEGFDFKPVRPKGAREKEVVGQDVNNAQRALALQQVEVAEVRQVGPGTRANLRLLRDYPLQLEPGDRVTLHEQDGIVKYYTRVAATDAGTADGRDVARIDGDLQSLKAQVRGMDAIRADVDSLKAADTQVEEQVGKGSGDLRAQAEEIARLKRELGDMRKATVAKDGEIAKLRTDLTAVRSAQDKLASQLSTERLDALEAQIRRLAPGEPAPPTRKADAPKPAPTVAKDAGRKAAGKPAAPAKKKAAATAKPAGTRKGGKG